MYGPCDVIIVLFINASRWLVIMLFMYAFVYTTTAILWPLGPLGLKEKLCGKVATGQMPFLSPNQ